MSTEDLLRNDVAYATGGLFGESVGYKSLLEYAESSIEWTFIEAVVDRVVDERGVSTDFGRSPIIAVISKADVSSVNCKIDKIKLGDNTYVVTEVVSEDSGAWTLYCVP